MTGAWLVALWLGIGVWLVASLRRSGALTPGEPYYESQVAFTVLFLPPLLVPIAAFAVAVLAAVVTIAIACGAFMLALLVASLPLLAAAWLGMHVVMAYQRLQLARTQRRLLRVLLTKEARGE